MYLVKSEIPIPDPLASEGIWIYFNTAFKQKGIEKLNQLFDARRIELDEVRSKPSDYLMAFRPNMVKLDFDGQLPRQTRCLYSYWKGYLENPDWTELQKHVQEIDGDFIPAHTSGHIFVDDLVNFVQSIGANQVIPIHTFEPNEFSKHFENVVVLNDGEQFEIGGGE
jgi:ribonuclease J